MRSGESTDRRTSSGTSRSAASAAARRSMCSASGPGASSRSSASRPGMGSERALDAVAEAEVAEAEVAETESAGTRARAAVEHCERTFQGRPRTRRRRPGHRRQEHRLVDAVAGGNVNRKRFRERRAVRLERGVCPVPLVFSLEDLAMEVEPESVPSRSHSMEETSRKGWCGLMSVGKNDGVLAPPGLPILTARPASSGRCSTTSPIRLLRKAAGATPSNVTLTLSFVR